MFFTLLKSDVSEEVLLSKIPVSSDSAFVNVGLFFLQTVKFTSFPSNLNKFDDILLVLEKEGQSRLLLSSNLFSEELV
jgi:hypothetical protein